MNEKILNKVLIVTYYWPPSGGSGVQRWLKMSKYLRDFGWEPVIFTPENPDFDLQDQSLLAEVPADIEVIRFPIWEPTRILSGKGKNMQKGQLLQAKHQGFFGKIATWIRGNFLLPDPKVFWAKPAAAFIKEIWRENEFKVLITTGPPHSMHLIGLRLKKDLGVSWVADFRDPWSRWDLLEDFSTGSMAMRYHKKKENEVLQLANKVLTIGHQLAKDLEKLGGRRVEIVHNGYDQADIPAVEIQEPQSILHLAHIGTITHSRFPLEWLESLHELCEEGRISSSQLRIRIIGNIDQQLPNWVAQYHQLKEIFSFESYMPHHEVFTAIAQSDLLLVFQNRTEDAKAHLPAKMFEYLGMKKPLWVIGNTQSDAAEIVLSTKSGVVTNFGAKDDLKKQWLYWLERHAAGELPHPEGVEQYSRKAQAGKMASILDSLR